jgi:hypothetical protein
MRFALKRQLWACPHPQPWGMHETTGENMDNHWEPHKTDEPRDIDAYQEMEYRLKSLRALVCDLLKTNQELRSALLDAGIDMLGGKAASFRAKPRRSI